MKAAFFKSRKAVIGSVAVVAAIAAVSTWVLVTADKDGSKGIQNVLGVNASVVRADNDFEISLKTGLTPVVNRALPSVVNIYTTKVIQQPDITFPMPFFERFFDPLPEEREAQSLGSGVIVGKDGFILTNDHVVRQTKEIRVRLGDEQEEWDAEIVGRDPRTDLALIKVDAGRELPVLAFADSSAAEVGSFVLAIGNPFGLDQTVTFGIISAKGRAGLGIEKLEDFIQTDAAINPGNSGGALVNMRGELIGINTAIVGGSGGNQGVGFAVPSNMAKNVMEQLLKQGRVVRGWLGVTIQNVTPSIAESLGLEGPGGVLIADVEIGSPADKAGVKRGDVIAELNGDPIEDSQELQLAVAEASPGDEAKLRVFRGNQTKSIVVKLGEMPEDTALEGGPAGKRDRGDRLGLQVQTLDDALARRLGVPEGRTGVVIIGVAAGSVAEEAGLKQGDVIEEVNRRSVADVRDFERAVRSAGDVVLLLVNRGGDYRYVALERD